MYKNQYVVGMSEEAGKRFRAYRNRNGMTTAACIIYLLDRVEREATNTRSEK